MKAISLYIGGSQSVSKYVRPDAKCQTVLTMWENPAIRIELTFSKNIIKISRLQEDTDFLKKSRKTKYPTHPSTSGEKLEKSDEVYVGS